MFFVGLLPAQSGQCEPKVCISDDSCCIRFVCNRCSTCTSAGLPQSLLHRPIGATGWIMHTLASDGKPPFLSTLR